MLLVGAATVALAAALPLVYLFVRAREVDATQARETLFRSHTLELLRNTVTLMGGVAVLSLTLGVAMAVIIARVRLPLPRLWWVLAALPLAVPSYVFSLTFLSWNPSWTGLWPSIAALTLTTMPYVTLPTLAAMLRADHSLVDVARTLGVGNVRAFFTITLPQILPAALAGTLLCALYALSDFAGPAMLRFPTLTVGVYRLYTGSLNRALAAVLALGLVVLAIIVVLGEQRLRRADRVRHAAVSVRRVPAVHLSRSRTVMAAVLLLAMAAASVLAPVVTLGWKMVEGSRYRIGWGDLSSAAFTTLTFGLTVAIVAGLLALPVAVLSARYSGLLTRMIEAISFLGQALPGIVVALAMVFLSLRLTPWAYQTAPVLIACYVILFLPKTLGSSRSAIQQVPRALEDASLTLGRGRWRTWWSVTVLRALPGIGAGGLLVMAATMKEVPATLLLRPTGTDTLATELWSMTSLGAYNAAAPAALILIAVGLVPALLLSRMGRNS